MISFSRDTRSNRQPGNVPRERIDTELGQDIFGQLLPDSQHYVATAEAIFWATEAFADRMDAALIAVEYAKAIETEIRGRFLPALVRFLDAKDYRGSLSIHNNHNIRRLARTLLGKVFSNHRLDHCLWVESST